MTRDIARRKDLCPAWCTGGHEPSDEAPVTHRSNPTSVPAVERRGSREGGLGAAATVELVVGLEQSRAELWVWIGPEDDASRSLAISFESAGRLNRALCLALEAGSAPN